MFIETVQGKGSYVSAPNRELARERRLRAAEEGLSRAVLEARGVGLSLYELTEMLATLWKENDHG